MVKVTILYRIFNLFHLIGKVVEVTWLCGRIDLHEVKEKTEAGIAFASEVVEAETIPLVVVRQTGVVTAAGHCQLY